MPGNPTERTPEYRAYMLGHSISAAARQAFQQRDIVEEHPVVKAIAVEAAGVYDILTGAANLTNPGDRLRLHAERIEALVLDLPRMDVTDGGAT